MTFNQQSYYYDHLCMRHTISQDISAQKLEVCIIHENYIINLFKG